MRRVSIVQRRLTHYRVPLFEQLRMRLLKSGIELQLIVGEGRVEEKSKQDHGRIDWAKLVTTRYLPGGLCWQPFINFASNSELVVITQENVLLANHLLLLKRPKNMRLAFWGHGANLQGNAQSLSERYKRWSTRQVDWWFAYSKLSVRLICKSGFPETRVTCLNNAIDVEELKSELNSICPMDLSAFRISIGLGNGPTAIFIGSLYSYKRLDFLVAASEEIGRLVPGFQLLIVGAGPDEAFIRDKAAVHSWLHYVGPQVGRQKALALALADVVLNPGLVGLGILDAFSAGLPIVTTNCGIHSPEIAYLDDSNGIVTLDQISDFVDATVSLLSDQNEMARLSSGAVAASRLYTLGNMVENFAEGITEALDVHHPGRTT